MNDEIASIPATGEPQTAAERDEVAVEWQDLHTFFTRREHPWQKKDRSKYTRHVGKRQQARYARQAEARRGEA